MKFNKKYDYMFRQMIANLPMTNHYDVRKLFQEWWMKLGKLVDTDKEANK